jgi:acyl-CoA thioesterase FadM
LNLLFRLLLVLVKALRSAPLTFGAPSTVGFRVLPHDLDINGHMNNGRYLTLMDLGRIDAIVRYGLLGTVLKRGWKPVAASAGCEFRRSLRPFERFELVSRVVCWDHRTFIIEQRFVRAGETVGVGIVKGLFVARGRSVPTAEVLAAAGHAGASPEAPAFVRLRVESERLAALERGWAFGAG